MLSSIEPENQTEEVWGAPHTSIIWSLVLLLVANGLIVADLTPGLRTMAALGLLAFLPGWVWSGIFFKQPALASKSPPGKPESFSPLNIYERLVLAIGLSLALTVYSAMLAVYLPGPLTALQLLIVSNMFIGVGLIAQWWQSRSAASSRRLLAQRGPLALGLLRRSPTLRLSRFLLILVALFILAASLRLPRLGYAEFHEDEAEALMLGVRLMQGEDYALFLHRKGPAQMLIPVAFWLVTDHIPEALARFPFALSSLLSVVTLFLMGRRWFNWPAGAIAALLWAINGYAIGFGRMVQYQALIFFLGPLAIYCLYLAWRSAQPYFQVLGAILLATCLLAHFDALLLLPAAAYLGWKAGGGEVGRVGEWESGRVGLPVRRAWEGWKTTRFNSTLIALVIFVALLASFYIPYVLDPEFKNTANYLAESRVKPGLLYNNLDLLQRLDQTYSSHFYLTILALGVVSFIIWQHKSFHPLILQIALALLLISTLWLPNLWQVGSWSLAGLPWLGLGLVCFWLWPQVEARAAWLMVSVPFIGYTFLVDDPRTHLYILYPGAVLLAGAGWAGFVGRLEGWEGGELGEKAQFSNFSILRTVNPLRFLILMAGGLVIAVIIVYSSIIFLSTESTLDRLRQRWAGSIWEALYDDLPKERDYFGYPKREGWKAIGALRAQGLFPGDFRSVNEDFIIPIWYNYGQARSCYDTPAQFFARAAGDQIPGVDEQVSNQYGEVGQIQREGETRLRVFSAGVPAAVSPANYPLEAFIPAFDQLATPQRFIQQAEPTHPLATQFGSAIQFVGYDLPRTIVAPGETLSVNLYWLARQHPEQNYRAFVHLTDGAALWGQQDDDPACRLPTAIWRTGQRGLGQFRLPIKPDAPPGRYPLIIGLYEAETLERLKITAGAGQVGDDFLWLADVEVVEK